MAWIVPTESDVLTVLAETELAAYRATALASGQADPVTPTLTLVVDMVRGYVGGYRGNVLGEAGTIPQKLLAPALDLVAVRLPQRVGVAPKEVRKLAYEQALRLLERVATGSFSIEEPEVAASEATAGPSPTLCSRERRFTRGTEEGL